MDALRVRICGVAPLRYETEEEFAFRSVLTQKVWQKVRYTVLSVHTQLCLDRVTHLCNEPLTESPLGVLFTQFNQLQRLQEIRFILSHLLEAE